jgi:hypothetical protein
MSLRAVDSESGWKPSAAAWRFEAIAQGDDRIIALVARELPCLPRSGASFSSGRIDLILGQALCGGPRRSARSCRRCWGRAAGCIELRLSLFPSDHHRLQTRPFWRKRIRAPEKTRKISIEPNKEIIRCHCFRPVQ